MKKIILVGLLGGVVMLAAGMILGPITYLIVPALETEYENMNLFRPWSDPLMSVFFVQPFILGIILAWIWSKVSGLFGEKITWKSGANFGMIYWLVTVPGMIISYSSFPLSLAMVMSWSVSIFVQAMCSGILFAKMLK
jgi:hypothetical protein